MMMMVMMMMVMMMVIVKVMMMMRTMIKTFVHVNLILFQNIKKLFQKVRQSL